MACKDLHLDVATGSNDGSTGQHDEREAPVGLEGNDEADNDGDNVLRHKARKASRHSLQKRDRERDSHSKRSATTRMSMVDTLRTARTLTMVASCAKRVVRAPVPFSLRSR